MQERKQFRERILLLGLLTYANESPVKKKVSVMWLYSLLINLHACYFQANVCELYTFKLIVNAELI